MATYKSHIEQISESLECIFASGGDSRLQVNSDTGLNAYGCSLRPVEDIVLMGSCTASSISMRGYLAAEQLLQRCQALAEEVDLEDVIREFYDGIRNELKYHLFGHALPNIDVVLSPSGTDAELLALAIAHGNGESRVTNIIIGPAEVGSGTTLAAAGKYFDALTPSGFASIKNTPVDSDLAEATEMVSIALRDLKGEPRDEQQLDAEVESLINDRIRRGNKVLLHVVAHSKTGLHAPSLGAIERLKVRHGSAVMVMIDAAQGRFSRRGLLKVCQDGHLVMVTGSKFFGGPPFSGALLIPVKSSPQLNGMKSLPKSYGHFFSRQYFPKSWDSLTAELPSHGDLGLLLRWTAALAEIRDYYSTPSRLRLQVLRDFEEMVPRIINDSDFINFDMVSEPVLANETERLLQSKSTVFSFFLSKNNGEMMKYEELRKVWKWLNMDLSALETFKESACKKSNLANLFQLGQPVRLGVGDSKEPSVLRIAIGGVLLSQVAQHVSWGDSYDARKKTLQQKLIELRNKIEAIAKNYDKLAANESAR